MTSHFQKWFYITYSTVLFGAGTAAFMGIACVGQLIWIVNRNFPGGPPAYLTIYQATQVATATNVMQTVVNILADTLLVCSSIWGASIAYMIYTHYTDLPVLYYLRVQTLGHCFTCYFLMWIRR
jgi:hypothetical protein